MKHLVILDKGALNVARILPRQPDKQYKRRKLEKIDMVVIHTTDMDISLKDLVSFDILPRPDHHISKSGTPAITYHEVIMQKGVPYHTLDYEEISWHAAGYNSRSVSLAMMFEATGIDAKGKRRDMFPPPHKVLSACIRRTTRVCLYLGLPPTAIKGHRELKGTGWFWRKGHKRLRKTCPGKQVDMDMFRTEVAKQMQSFLHQRGFYTGLIDGLWGPKSQGALLRALR